MTLIVYAIFFWANFNLFLSRLLLQFKFQGAFFIFLIGLPLIILSVVLIKSSKESIMKQDIQFLTKPEEIGEMMDCFLSLIDNKIESRVDEIILKGYIISHEPNCLFVDCPLKNVKRMMDSQYVITNENKRHNSRGSNHSFSINSEIHHELLLYVNKVYVLGLLKFPKCSSLRISYALFLFYYLKQRTKAKTELENVEKEKPPLHEQFTVFRYKRNLTEEQDADPTDDSDMVAGIAYDSHFRQCKFFILETAKHFFDFWSALGENENTDISLLNHIGLKINQGLRNVNVHW